MQDFRQTVRKSGLRGEVSIFSVSEKQRRMKVNRIKWTKFSALFLCLALLVSGCGGAERKTAGAESGQNASEPAGQQNSGDTLKKLQPTWNNNIDPDKTVEIVNDMREHAVAGETIFYDITRLR